MVLRRSFSRPLRQGQRRKTEWAASADVTAVTALAAGGEILDSSLSEAILGGAGLLPSTIIRTRGVLWSRSDQDAANESAFGAMSMAVTSEPARAVGVGALLTPIVDEAGDQFFVYQTWFAGNGGPSTGALFSQPWYAQEFDSKAQRKVEGGNAIVVVLENASAAHGAEFIIKFRMLFKVH